MRRFKYEIIIAVLFVLVRLPSLGHDNFNTDVWKWKVRSYDFSTAIFTFQPERTLQKYHPGVTLMWIGTAGIKIANLISDYNVSLNELQKLFLMDQVQKTFLVLVLAVVVANIFYVLRQLSGVNLATLAVLLLMFEPFYLALTRVFHLEGLLSTFMLASALWLYFYLQDKSQNKRLYLSAIFAGLSVLTKTSGIFMILFAGLVMLLQFKESKRFKPELLWFLKWFGVALLTCVVLWPALWANPALVINELTRGVVEIGVDTEHVQYYFGRLVENPGPTYFFVVLGLRSSVYLLLGLLGLAFVFKKLGVQEKKIIQYFLIFALFYFIQITLPTKKLDRYILPGFVALSLCATFFWSHVLSKIKLQNYVGYGLLLLPALATAFIVHPDYFSYFNPLFGGARAGIHTIEPKWLIGERQILSYFKNVYAAEGFVPSGQDESFEEVIYGGENKNVLSVGFQEKYYTQIWPFFREIDSWAVIQDLSPFAVKTRYFVYPVWDDRAAEENRFGLKYKDSIYIRGVPAYRVYERII